MLDTTGTSGGSGHTPPPCPPKGYAHPSPYHRRPCTPRAIIIGHSTQGFGPAIPPEHRSAPPLRNAVFLWWLLEEGITGSIAWSGRVAELTSGAFVGGLGAGVGGVTRAGGGKRARLHNGRGHVMGRALV